MLKILGLIFAPLLLLSCANSTSTISPTTNVKSLKRFHVVKVEGDGYNMDQVIAADLKSRGFKASTGLKQNSVDAVVTYNDKWTWDMTMYLLQLDVKLIDPKSHQQLASAKVYRPSLQRKSKEAVVKEVLDKIFIAN